MDPSHWWANRRFGMMIDVSVATVPGWAPVGQQAAWYRAHLDGTTRDLNLHPSPLVETLHHHRERWGHIEAYDDFFPFLHFDRFDADEKSVAMGKGKCWRIGPFTEEGVS